MPIVTPIPEALADQPLAVVVTAVSEIAATLARLAEKKVGHRDIKPGNPYRLDGHWLVGDFGLVAAPDLDDLTRAGKHLEMIRDRVNADPLPADVSSSEAHLWIIEIGDSQARKRGVSPDLTFEMGTKRVYKIRLFAPS